MSNAPATAPAPGTTTADPNLLATYTPAGVLCFANTLFVPRPTQEGGKERYSCILLMDARAIKSNAYMDLRRIVANAVTKKWGAAKAADQNFRRTLHLPFRNAREKDYEGFENGEIFINPWTSVENPPEINDLKGNLLTTSRDVWSGQMARLLVKAFAYDNSGNKGVGFILNAVQILKTDMPRLDGRFKPGEAFKAASEEELLAIGVDPNAVSASDDPMGDDPF